MMLARRTLFSHPSRRRQPPAASETQAAPQYRCSTKPRRPSRWRSIPGPGAAFHDLLCDPASCRMPRHFNVADLSVCESDDEEDVKRLEQGRGLEGPLEVAIFSSSKKCSPGGPARLTVSLLTAPLKSVASARRTRRVLVPDRYPPAISAWLIETIDRLQTIEYECGHRSHVRLK
jgi:hypothetical protein